MDLLELRERQVLQLLADGHRYAAAGKRLGLASETVRHYAYTARGKLDAGTVTGAVAIALRRHLIQ